MHVAIRVFVTGDAFLQSSAFDNLDPNQACMTIADPA